jgi:hypothetical protein
VVLASATLHKKKGKTITEKKRFIILFFCIAFIVIFLPRKSKKSEPFYSEVFWYYFLFGGWGEDRTPGQLVKSQMLYH